MGKTTYYINPKRINKFSKEDTISLTFDLINAFSMVKTPYETTLLMQDLLTASEVEQLAKRLRIAKLLLSGETQREISKELHCSLATITKVSAWLNQGGEGLKKIINKLPKEYELPKKLPRGPIEFYLPQLLSAIGQYSLAKYQVGPTKNFIENMQNKKITDKVLQEAFDQEFKYFKRK